MLILWQLMPYQLFAWLHWWIWIFRSILFILVLIFYNGYRCILASLILYDGPYSVLSVSSHSIMIISSSQEMKVMFLLLLWNFMYHHLSSVSQQLFQIPGLNLATLGWRFLIYRWQSYSLHSVYFSGTQLLYKLWQLSPCSQTCVDSRRSNEVHW